MQMSMEKTQMINRQDKMKKNQVFLISKFLKFYGEEFDKEPINQNILPNTKEKAICTVIGLPNLKLKLLEDQ